MNLIKSVATDALHSAFIPPDLPELFQKREQLLEQSRTLQLEIEHVTHELESRLSDLPGGPEAFANEFFARTLGLMHDF